MKYNLNDWYLLRQQDILEKIHNFDEIVDQFFDQQNDEIENDQKKKIKSGDMTHLMEETIKTDDIDSTEREEQV